MLHDIKTRDDLTESLHARAMDYAQRRAVLEKNWALLLREGNLRSVTLEEGRDDLVVLLFECAFMGDVWDDSRSVPLRHFEVEPSVWTAELKAQMLEQERLMAEREKKAVTEREARMKRDLIAKAKALGLTAEDLKE